MMFSLVGQTDWSVRFRRGLACDLGPVYPDAIRYAIEIRGSFSILPWQAASH
jgi:hypothetical protein